MFDQITKEWTEPTEDVAAILGFMEEIFANRRQETADGTNDWTLAGAYNEVKKSSKFPTVSDEAIDEAITRAVIIETTDKLKHTPVSMAASKGHVNIVKLIRERRPQCTIGFVNSK